MMAPAKKKQRLSNGSAAAVVTDEDTAEQDHDSELQHSRNGPPEQRRSLFIGSLPTNTTSESLTDLFSEAFPIKHATAVTDRKTKECIGYGFVTFADPEDAQRARKTFNGHIVDGHKLQVEVAKPRHRDAERGQASQGSKVNYSKKPQDLPQPSRLIVRNLPWTIKTPEQLSKLFLSYGKVKQAHIPKIRHGLMAGFGFVVLRGRKNAEKALEGINGKEIGGRTLAVDWAVNKEVYDDSLKRDAEQAEVEEDEAPNVQSGSDLGDDIEGAAEDVNGAFGNGDGMSNSEDEDPEADEDEGVDVRMEGEDRTNLDPHEDRSSTLFVRNLPYTCTDEDLEDHFAAFGKPRYARIVIDLDTGRPRGTGFVCFYNKSDADTCLRHAPRRALPSEYESKDKASKQPMNSILQNQELDISGQYTMDGRVLQVSPAVDKTEANRLTEEGAAHRRKRNEDKRRLYLLSEGTISSNSKLWDKLSPTEKNMREESTRQRKAQVESNPSLYLSLTRLAVRNIPRTVTSEALKTLARKAVVGFATDVKAGIRSRLSKEELARGGEDMEAAEKARKMAGKGVVKQANVVFEGAGGSKVKEASGAGRSRGHGFIEYYTHRSALMGLRWLNGHALGYQVRDEKKGNIGKEQLQDRKKRLIVGFAIENAQVVMRRKAREMKAQERSGTTVDGEIREQEASRSPRGPKSNQDYDARKRKRGSSSSSKIGSQNSRKIGGGRKQEDPQKKPVDDKIAQRNRIIGRKRAIRSRRKGTKQ